MTTNAPASLARPMASARSSTGGASKPVSIALCPRRRTELRPDDRGEALVAQVARVGHLPAVLGLEVVGEAGEVVFCASVGGKWFLLGF